MHKNGIVRMMLAGVVVLSLVAFLGACGGGGDSGGAAGTTATITLEASGSSIPADGTSSVVIKATIKDSAGNPVRHFTDVTFTTTLGHFKNGSTSYTMQTQPPLGENGLPDIKAAPTGIAEVTFTGGHIGGPAKITASSIGVTQSVYVTVTGSSAGITLTADPTTIPADGKSSTTITATLTDSSGSPVKPGTEVTFSTGLGYFLSDSKSYTVSTADKTGIVKVSLHAGVVPGTTYVQATSGDAAQALSIVLTKTDPLYADISVEANPSRIPADGKSQSVITATVIRTQTGAANAAPEASGQPIPDIPITFYKITANVESKPLPEGNTYKGEGSSIVGPFYSYGGVTTFFILVDPSGGSPFTLWLFDPLKQERQLLVSKPDVIAYESFSVATSLLPGNYQLETQANTDCYWEVKVDGNIGPAQTGKTVLGFGKTDGSGKVSHTYTADWLPGTFSVRAETGELSNSDNALSDETTLTQGPLAPIVINAASSSIYANGTTTTSVTAQVWTKEGNKVPDGTAVYFSATAGTITPSAVTVAGLASATLTSVASAASVVSTVKATVGADSASATITFLGVALSDMQANPATIFANGTDTSEISVRIRDANGLAVEGETVTFTSTLGSIQTATATTGSDGVARTNLIAPNSVGTATVTASYGLITATTTVSFTSSVPVGTITLTANPTSIPANGTSSSTISATLKDTSGKAVPKGTLVTFTTNLGKLGSGAQTQSVITPDDTGVVSVSLISGTTAGSATVTATSNSVTQSVTVTFTGTVVGSIAVTATPSTLTADGKSTSEIRAAVKDAQGNPIADGETITFTITSGSGTLSASSAATTGGYATVTYTAGSAAGSVIIEARAQNNVSGTVTITLTSTTAGTISLTASPSSLPADGASSSAVTAIIRDGAGSPVPKGTSVTFTTTLGKFSNGTTTITVTTIADTGMATVSLIAASTPGTASVKASSGGVSQTTTLTFIGGGQPASLSLNSSKKSVKSDNSDSATITATLLDGNNAPIAGYVVAFSADTGQISASSATTDANGQAKITFSAGINSTNRIATITATVAATPAPLTANIPIEILGSTLTLTTDRTTIPEDGSVVATLTATIKDGGGSAVEGEFITFTVAGTGGANVAPASGTTDASGTLQVTVTGTAQGQVTVTANWGGTTAAQQYNVTPAADTFAIVLPDATPFTTKTRTVATLVTTPDDNSIAFNDNGAAADTITTTGAFGAYSAGDQIMVGGSLNNDGVYTISGTIPPTPNTLTLVSTDVLANEPAGNLVTITNGVLVRVRAPDPINTVVFSTTIGVWDGGVSPIVPKTPVPASNYIWAVLTSNLAGTATVQVYDEANPSTSDKTTVVFSVPSGNAAQLSLQSNVYTVAPSIGGTKNTATLTATVRTSVAEGSQVVSGVAVAFSIVNPTGGGEYVEPVVTITDSAGQAKATFTSGSLSSGAGGVTISAYVVANPAISDSIAIVIGGIAGSVVIGRGTVIYDLDDATYRLPMAALVTDSNGNAVSGAVVTLSAWPLQYAPGVWYDSDPNPQAELYTVYYTGNFINNEDANENLILDPSEDKDGDKLLTPASSSAGGVPVPSQVVTGANGVATFDLIYLKANAMWIKTRIRARTFVVGTETTSSVEMVLPPEKLQAETGLLPDSPFPIGLVTSVGVPVSYTFPVFYGAGDTFTTSGNLSKGSSTAVGYLYTYTPLTPPPAIAGDIVWDYVSVINTFWGAYFPVRIIIQ